MSHELIHHSLKPLLNITVFLPSRKCHSVDDQIAILYHVTLEYKMEQLI